jgi:tetratricopeptide (TPR) repeat protein
MNKTAKRIAGIIAILALAAGGWWLGVKDKHYAIVAAHLPAVPPLDDEHPELAERIAAADAEALSRWGSRDGLAELSRLYHANGYLNAAIATYDGLAELEPEEARWPHLHATILAGFGQATPAIALWDRTIALAPDYLPTQLRRADLLLKDNQMETAEAAYRAVLERERDNAWALLGLARIDLENEQWQDARVRLERVVALTNYALGYDLIVTLYERLGEDRAAEAIRGRSFASGAYRDPTDPWLDTLMEDCYDSFRLALEAGAKARHNDNETARRWLERAIAVAPNDVSAHFQLAGFLREQRDVAGAMTHYRRCTELDPQFADGWAQLSALQAQIGETAASQRTLAAGLEHCPDSPGLHRMQARRLRDSGQVGAAIMSFRRAIELRPNEPDPYLELGTTLLGANRTAEGIREIENALVWDPLNPTGLGILAFHAIESQNQPAADHWMTQVERQPRLDSAQVNQLRAVYREAFGQRWGE